MRKVLFILSLLFFVGISVADAQVAKTKQTTPAAKPKQVVQQPTLSPAEQAAQARAQEMLENTRVVTFIDSLVVDKDDFLRHLKLSQDAGRFDDPNNFFAEDNLPEMGHAAFVNAVSNVVYFSAADSTGNVCLHNSYRSGKIWSTPQTVQGLTDFTYEDYPYLLSDGITLYFSAKGDESIGGLDIFETRYNSNTRQFVRPENVGYPFNSTANDYLLAIDEAAGVGALVTDRRQPDDKVCIYWFDAENFGERVNYTYDAADVAGSAQVKNYAMISSIGATQKDKNEVARIKKNWEEVLASSSTANKQIRYVVNDDVVYTDISQFKSTSAKALATKWAESAQQLDEMEEKLDKFRSEYAEYHSSKVAGEINNLEVQTVQLRLQTESLAKQFRAAELGQ